MRVTIIRQQENAREDDFYGERDMSEYRWIRVDDDAEPEIALRRGDGNAWGLPDWDILEHARWIGIGGTLSSPPTEWEGPFERPELELRGITSPGLGDIVQATLARSAKGISPSSPLWTPFLATLGNKEKP